MFFVGLTIVLMINSFTNAQDLSIKKFITDCRQNNNNDLDSCLLKLLQHIKPRLSAGIPELNIPVLEPIKLPLWSIQHDQGGVLLNATFDEVMVNGFSNHEVRTLKSNIDQGTIKSRIYIPSLFVRGKYNLDGNVILVPIKGNGNFTLDINELFATVSGKIVLRSNGANEEVFGVENTQVALKFGKININMENLFNGDKVLGDTVNHFLNENSNLIFGELDIGVTNSISNMVEEVLDRAVSNFPVSLIEN